MSLSSQHGEHYRMELFEAGNFSGQGVELCDDCPFLQARGLTKNCINSLKVYGDGAYVYLRPQTGFELTVTGALHTFQYVLQHFPSSCLSTELNFSEKAHLCDRSVTGSFHTLAFFFVLNQADSYINSCEVKLSVSVESRQDGLKGKKRG